MKTFQSIISSIGGHVWQVGIPIPDKISKELVKEGEKRVVCTIEEERFQAALIPDGSGGFFVLLNKERRKKLGKDVGDTIEISLEKDDSKYGMPMPEEFQELLNQDPEGDTLFHRLTPGKQRSLLHIIGKPKTSNTRLTKAIVIISYLKSTGGMLDYKELNEAFKHNRL